MALWNLFRKKSKPEGDAAAPGPRHCFVLCAEAEPADPATVAAAVRAVFGKGYGVERSEGDVVTVARGDETVGFLAFIAAPIPGGEAEANVEGNFLWPDGRDAVAAHRAQVIVTNVGAKARTPVQSALALSKLALVALKAYGGIGVYWGEAGVVNSRELFEDTCAGISEAHLPVPVWLRFQFVQPSDDALGLYTYGMGQFGLMEIEVDRSPMDAEALFDFVANIAHYLIQSGPVIADGNTVGGSATERILVQHRPSARGDDRLAYKIVFEG